MNWGRGQERKDCRCTEKIRHDAATATTHDDESTHSHTHTCPKSRHNRGVVLPPRMSFLSDDIVSLWAYVWVCVRCWTNAECWVNQACRRFGKKMGSERYKFDLFKQVSYYGQICGTWQYHHHHHRQTKPDCECVWEREGLTSLPLFLSFPFHLTESRVSWNDDGFKFGRGMMILVRVEERWDFENLRSGSGRRSRKESINGHEEKSETMMMNPWLLWKGHQSGKKSNDRTEHTIILLTHTLEGEGGEKFEDQPHRHERDIERNGFVIKSLMVC